MHVVKKYFLSKGYEVFEEYKFNRDELWFADICCKKDNDIILVEIEISSSAVDIIKNCKKMPESQGNNKIGVGNIY